MSATFDGGIVVRRRAAFKAKAGVTLADMIADLPLGTLLVADAGDAGFDLIKCLIEARVDFLIRCGGNVRLLVDGTCQQIMGRRV